MSLGDLLLVVLLVGLAGRLAALSRLLYQSRDPLSAIERQYKTLFPQTAASLLRFAHHVSAVSRRRAPQRRRHAVQAVSAFAVSAMLILAPVGAAFATDTGSLAHHVVAVAAGTAAWSVVVELPGQAAAAPNKRLMHPLCAAAILVVMDLVLGGIAIGHLFEGATVRALSQGASLVAAADLVSALVALTLAAVAEGDTDGS